jgi:diguanylate cyclase (GGDEF)-like protein
MDRPTALLFSSFMVLLNGGLLGLMHRSLIFEVRPSAVDWRIGTLLFAIGGILMALSDKLLHPVMVPLSYAYVLVGATLYWRANRKFCGLPSDLRIFVPAAVGIAIVFWLTWPTPELRLRPMLGSIMLALILAAAGRTIQTAPRLDAILSGRVMIALLYAVAGFTFARSVFYALAFSWSSFGGYGEVMDMLTAMMVPALPLIGTTAFLLMCAERGRIALQRMADTDHLTGVPNRRTITRVGTRRFDSARRHGRSFAIAVIDIDFFKQINDRYGHDVGDVALCHVARVLSACCGEPHLFGRQGGEEFVALFEVADADSARSLAESLRQALHAHPLRIDTPSLQPARADFGELALRASIGVAAIDDEDADFDHLLRRADAALYAAKANGRDRVELMA